LAKQADFRLEALRTRGFEEVGKAIVVSLKVELADNRADASAPVQHAHIDEIGDAAPHRHAAHPEAGSEVVLRRELVPRLEHAGHDLLAQSVPDLDIESDPVSLVQHLD